MQFTTTRTEAVNKSLILISLFLYGCHWWIFVCLIFHPKHLKQCGQFISLWGFVKARNRKKNNNILSFETYTVKTSINNTVPNSKKIFFDAFILINERFDANICHQFHHTLSYLPHNSFFGSLFFCISNENKGGKEDELDRLSR